MANVRNTFNITLGSVSLVEEQAFPGMTKEGDVVISNFVPEASSVFQKAIYKTLIDAGYDATMNASAYTVTVLGFTFFTIVKSASGNVDSYDAYPYIYAYGHEHYLFGTSITSRLLNDGSGGYTLSFSIQVRGGQEALAISLNGYSSADDNQLMLLLSKAINMVTQKEAFFYAGADNSQVTTYSYVRDADDAYTVIREEYNSGVSGVNDGRCIFCYTEYGEMGQSASMITCLPVIAHFGTYLVYPLLVGRDDLDAGYYYEIGSELYWLVGSTASNASSSDFTGTGAHYFLKME